MLQRIMAILIIVVFVLGSGYYVYQQLVPPPEEVDKGLDYATKPVVRGDISVGVEATGTLNPSKGGGLRVPGSRAGTFSGSYGFIVDEILVEEGDEVRKGQVVVKLKSPDLAARIENLEEQIEAQRQSVADLMNVSPDRLDFVDPSRGITLQAPIDGRVTDLRVKEGDELQKGEIVATIVDDSRFRLVAKLTPAEFQDVTIGQRAVLNFPQFDGFVEARVTDVNPDPVPELVSKLTGRGSSDSGEERYQFVYWVTLEGENPGLVQPGMRVNVGLVSDSGAVGSAAGEVDLTNVRWIGYPAWIERYVEEEKVLSRAEAIATEVHVHNMEKVKKGDPLISLSGEDAQDTIKEELDKLRQLEEELQELRSLFNQMEVTSPMDGVVAHFGTEIGATVQPGEWLGYIYHTSDMRMGVSVDDVDVLLVRQGAPVQVTLDAVPGKVFQGEVEHVSTMGQGQEGITRFHVEIKVKGGPELRPGMQARAYIDAGSAENVLLVPLEAVFEEDGKPKVEVLQPDGTVKVVTVKLGLMNDRVAEVKSGLEEGEQVIVGSSADLLPSLRIQSQDSLLPDRSGSSDGQSGPGNDSTGTPSKGEVSR